MNDEWKSHRVGFGNLSEIAEGMWLPDKRAIVGMANELLALRARSAAAAAAVAVVEAARAYVRYYRDDSVPPDDAVAERLADALAVALFDYDAAARGSETKAEVTAADLAKYDCPRPPAASSPALTAEAMYVHALPLNLAPRWKHYGVPPELWPTRLNDSERVVGVSLLAHMVEEAEAKGRAAEAAARADGVMEGHVSRGYLQDVGDALMRAGRHCVLGMHHSGLAHEVDLLGADVSRLTRELEEARARADRAEIVADELSKWPKTEASGEAKHARTALEACMWNWLQGNSNTAAMLDRLEAWLAARGGKAAT